VESSTREVERELDSITSRLSTLLATLQEFPVIRYVHGVGAAKDMQGEGVLLEAALCGTTLASGSLVLHHPSRLA
jgi:hypothetical protein